MTRNELMEIMKDGRIVGVTFRKKDNSERKMACRLGVTSHLKGGTKGYNDEDYNLLTVFDMASNGYRSIPVDGLIEVRKNGAVVYPQ